MFLHQNAFGTYVSHRARMYQKSRNFGFVHNPEFDDCRLLRDASENGTTRTKEFRATIGEDGFRKIPGTGNTAATKKIWCLGCSFTFGFGVNDDEVYPALIQRKFPDADVLNLGVCAYGTFQSLLVLRERLKSEKPDVVILGHLSAHVQRNIVSPFWMSQVAQAGDASENLNGEGIWQPRAICTFEEQIEVERVPFGDQHVHLVNRAIVSPVVHHGYFILSLLLREFTRLAERHGFKLIVASLLAMTTKYDEEFARQVQASPAIWVDASLPDATEAYLCLPFDMHPNAEGHKFYEKALSGALADPEIEFTHKGGSYS